MVTEVIIFRKRSGGFGEIPTTSSGDVTDQTVHHTFFDTEVYDLFLVTILDSSELSLLGLLADNLDLLDHLGGKVLGGYLGIIQEESLTSDGDLGNRLTVSRDSSVISNLNTRELLQQVDKHVILSRLERRSVILDSVFLYYNRITGS